MIVSEPRIVSSTARNSIPSGTSRNQLLGLRMSKMSQKLASTTAMLKAASPYFVKPFAIRTLALAYMSVKGIKGVFRAPPDYGQSWR